MDGFKPIELPPARNHLATAAEFSSGPLVAPIVRVTTYDSDEWEAFVNEWAARCLDGVYKTVRRFSGGNDRGIDVAGFLDDDLLNGQWDCFQCKHYARPLSPGNAWPEIGKILWHSYNGHYRAPRHYRFVAPRNASTTLGLYLANATKLKQEFKRAWNSSIANAITTAEEIRLEGEFARYVEEFDFSIFAEKPVLEIIEEHRQTPYFVHRFGGGLPSRPYPEAPPERIAPQENRYVQELLNAYSQHLGEPTFSLTELARNSRLTRHFRRQREAFYHAEGLRVFVRDKVEPGTFESLQDEVFAGVIDTCESHHADGLSRVIAVVQAAQSMQLNAHPLAPMTFTQDRHGICHQLANEDRLKWSG